MNAAVARVERLEGDRWAAFVRGDAATLSALVADDLVYRHASGMTDDRDSYLARVRQRSGVFIDFDYEVHRVEEHRGVVLVHGRMEATLVMDSASTPMMLDYLAVWEPDEAGDWRTVAVHAAPLAS